MKAIKQGKSGQMDMINGSLIKNILYFSLPLAASSILQQLFNSCDVAVVGRFAGSDSLAAVGSNAPVTALFVNIFVGLSVGANVVIAKYIGQQKKEKIQDVIHTVITFAIISGICMIFLGQLIARPILSIIDTPKEVLNLAVIYLRIYFAGMPFIILYNFGAAILRSVGNTKRPLYCLIISGVVNVCLNLFFVIVCHMGVAGVALATMIANCISSCIVIWSLTREDEMIRLHFDRLKIHKHALISVLKVGTPSSIQSGVFSLSNVIIQTGINSFGANATAGSSAALNFEYFTYFMASSFSTAAVTFVSQNYGAERYDRCKKACRVSMIEGMLLTMIMSGIFIAARYRWAGIYSTDEAVIEYAVIRMTHVMALEFMTASYEVTGAALRGIGYSLLPAMLTVLGSVCFRIVWLYTVFEEHHSFGMLMTVYPVSWVITGTMVITAYLIISRRVYRS